MKVTVERAELLKSLSHVHRVVERRNTIPILSNVLLSCKDAKLSLKATDLDVEVIETVSAEASPGGATTVPTPGRASSHRSWIKCCTALCAVLG